MRNRSVSNSPTDRNQRRVSAITRAAQRDLRTPEQQIAVLDGRLGVGVGAARERALLTYKTKRNRKAGATA